jgi:hypothetical protein
VIAGVVVGVAATVVIAAVGGRSGDEPARPRAESGAARAYIDAWRRSQKGTWSVKLHWVRDTRRGGHLEDVISIAQRPPDRMVVGAGAVEGRRGDRVLACSAGTDGQYRCRAGGAAPAYDDEVARGAAVLEQQLVGPQRLYDVARSGANCYELRLRVRYPAAPSGARARLCFDEASGAPTLRDIIRAEGGDRQEAVAVTAQVDDADLIPPAGIAG